MSLIRIHKKIDRKIKNNQSRGDHYTTKLAYLGKSYSTLVFDRYHQGRISLEKASKYLDIKIKYFSKLDEYFKEGLKDVRV